MDIKEPQPQPVSPVDDIYNRFCGYRDTHLQDQTQAANRPGNNQQVNPSKAAYFGISKAILDLRLYPDLPSEKYQDLARRFFEVASAEVSAWYQYVTASAIEISNPSNKKFAAVLKPLLFQNSANNRQ